MMITGSVQYKNQRLYMVINLQDNTTGRRKPKWIATGLPAKGNKRKAEQMLQAELKKYEGVSVSSVNVTFSDYCVKWLENKKIDIEEDTFVTYSNQVRRIIDYFQPKKTLLNELKPLQIRDFYLYLAKNGNLKTGKPLSARFIKDIAQRTRTILQDAVQMELLKTNPAQGIKPPKPLDHDRCQDDDDVYMDREDLRIFFAQVKDEPLYELFLATVFGGFRREEVGGLNWPRVDFEARTITVVETRCGQEERNIRNPVQKIRRHIGCTRWGITSIPCLTKLKRNNRKIKDCLAPNMHKIVEKYLRGRTGVRSVWIILRSGLRIL